MFSLSLILTFNYWPRAKNERTKIIYLFFFFSTSTCFSISMESTTEVNLGKSIIVPSVQQLSKEPIINIPARYVRDDQEDPLIVSHDSSLPSVPVIDLERLDVEDCMNSELDRIHFACKDWGFFQVCMVLCCRINVFILSWVTLLCVTWSWDLFILMFQNMVFIKALLNCNILI